MSTFIFVFFLLLFAVVGVIVARKIDFFLTDARKKKHPDDHWPH